MTRLKIGIVGCGAIGSSLAKSIVKDFKQTAELVALYDINPKKSENLSRIVSRKNNLVVRGLGELIKKAGLVIEASSAKSSFAISQGALSKGRNIMIMSVGGIISRVNKLSGLAKKYHARVYIPSGAICGIDGLKAANIGKIKKVTLTTRKNPLSFKGVGYVERKGLNLQGIKKEKVLFSGSAKQAVKYFPQNINVAAVLSIAGIGEKRTKVTIVASPGVHRNVHEIKIESQSGTIFTRTENILHPDNPKTSYLAVLSAVATLKQILEPVKIGT